MGFSSLLLFTPEGFVGAVNSPLPLAHSHQGLSVFGKCYMLLGSWIALRVSSQMQMQGIYLSLPPPASQVPTLPTGCMPRFPVTPTATRIEENRPVWNQTPQLEVLSLSLTATSSWGGEVPSPTCAHEYYFLLPMTTLSPAFLSDLPHSPADLLHTF